ncbi:hypothetical protein [Methanofollis fontis]|uniref:Uncharacterized protein n=1 Tax=Methanofollis fontis TaxID=2052832 RepID=A0A483CRH5_9EURY|nr:hypothetical protein [Methanofollis fontis]TAJ43629.1 hypothetical protein CUJ86_09795 [Methanofollis fontis]
MYKRSCPRCGRVEYSHRRDDDDDLCGGCGRRCRVVYLTEKEWEDEIPLPPLSGRHALRALAVDPRQVPLCPQEG